MADLSVLKRLPASRRASGGSALQHFADAREQALLAADPADAQLLDSFDRGRGGGVLIELRQNLAEEAILGFGRIVL